MAEESVNGGLDGKNYNRAVRVHKYIYEALMRLAYVGIVYTLGRGQCSREKCCDQVVLGGGEQNDLRVGPTPIRQSAATQKP